MSVTSRRIINWRLAVQWLVILALCSAFTRFNYVYIRGNHSSPIVEKINPLSYDVQFNLEQQHPTTFFTLPAFPAYAQWCHDHQKFCSLVPLQKLYADMQWIGSIQYVGSVGGKELTSGLSKLIDNVTTLDPYRYYPYVFGQLMIPMQKKPGSTGDVEQQVASRQTSRSLADKGMGYICDQGKIARIKSLSGEVFIRDVFDSGARALNGNACPTYELPHYAGFNAFYYRNDAEDSAKNYMISAFHDDAPGITPVMAAMVYGRGGQHMKSATLRYDRYINLGAEDALSDDILKADASKAIKKSVFELQLQIITEAEEMSDGSCEKDFNCLTKHGYVATSLQHTYKEICSSGTNKTNIRCSLLSIGIKRGWISLANNSFTYPDDASYVFARSKEYSSRRIRPGE